jgi:7-carboxy-7-deazaguanine synthase
MGKINIKKLKISSLPVNEIFYSLQGEGTLAGVPSVFIRLAGCPIQCSWCDTRYAWDVRKARPMTIDEILVKIREYPTRHVVLTGGEPLIHPAVTELTARLKRLAFHVTLETAGIVYRKVRCDLLSLSPKLPRSVPGKTTFRPAILKKLIAAAKAVQVKFVVGNLDQVCRVADLLEKYPFLRPETVMLMPKAKTFAEYAKLAPDIARWALHNNLRFCPRLHLELGIK